MANRPASSLNSLIKKELAAEDPVAVALTELVQGASLLKAVKNGKPHFRDFSVSQDLTKLQWKSSSQPASKRADTFVNIADITDVLHGQKTKIFRDNPIQEHESVSFSLLCKSRSVDIVCRDQREYETWTRGLGALIEGYRDVSAVMAVYDKHRRANNQQGLKVGFNSQGQLTVAVQDESCDVYTWGNGTNGILGHGDEEDEKSPRVLEAVLGRGIKQLALGDRHSLALSTSGELYSWGNGQFGKLGHSNLHPRFLPLRIGGVLEDNEVISIDCDTLHSGAVLETGSVCTWGQASDPDCGRLGYPCNRRATTPTQVPGLQDHFAIKITCGADFSLVLTDSLSVVAFGDNSTGQLGYGEEKAGKCLPLHFGTGIEIEEVAAGSRHAAAISNEGELFLWGSNAYGQCALGEKPIVWQPTRIPLPEKVSAVACGEIHTLVLGESGTMYTCGSNNDNQLGIASIAKKAKCTSLSALPPGNVKFVLAAAGARASAAISDNGRLYTWGSGDDGLLGHGDNKPRLVPTEVSALSDKMVRSVFIGSHHMGALILNKWVADDEAKLCMSCKLKFTTVRRRHHCRQCGGVFCANCTTKRYPLLEKGFSDPVRVCDRCYSLLTKKA